jgi:hypothetical protein
MLIIGFGVTEALLSTLVFTCVTCGNHAAHQLTKQNRKFSLFFIPLFSVGTKYLDSCTACVRIVEVSKVQAEAAAPAGRSGPAVIRLRLSLRLKAADQRPGGLARSNLGVGVGQHVRRRRRHRQQLAISEQGAAIAGLFGMVLRARDDAGLPQVYRSSRSGSALACRAVTDR